MGSSPIRVDFLNFTTRIRGERSTSLLMFWMHNNKLGRLSIPISMQLHQDAATMATGIDPIGDHRSRYMTANDVLKTSKIYLATQLLLNVVYMVT